MAMLFIAPIPTIILLKLVIMYAYPVIYEYFLIDLSIYNNYILAAAMAFSPVILGIVVGFMMIDERDGNIVQLMAVTPLGRSGYIVNRLFLAVMAAIIYALLSVLFLDIISVPFITICFMALLMGALTVIFALVLYTFADNKVKGLAYAKGLNIIVLFTFADIIDESWMKIVSFLVPTSWTVRMINNPYQMSNILFALMIYSIWMIAIFRIDYMNFERV